VTLCKKRPWDDAVDGPIPPPFSFRELFRPPPPQPVQIALPSFQTPLKALLSLQGDHQLSNLSTALTLIYTLIAHPSCTQYRSNFLNRIIQPTILSGIRQVRWPGRLHFLYMKFPDPPPAIAPAACRLNPNLNLNPQLQLDLTLIIDGAHNISACTALQAYLNTQHLTDRRTFIIALSQQTGKRPLETLGPLLRPGDSVAVVPFSKVDGMFWVKPYGPKELCAEVREMVGPEGTIWCNGEEENEEWETAKLTNRHEERLAVQNQLSKALIWADSRIKLAILTGSLYLIADLYRLIKHEEGPTRVV